jgi:hypothetical protein
MFETQTGLFWEKGGDERRFIGEWNKPLQLGSLGSVMWMMMFDVSLRNSSPDPKTLNHRNSSPDPKLIFQERDKIDGRRKGGKMSSLN